MEDRNVTKKWLIISILAGLILGVGAAGCSSTTGREPTAFTGEGNPHSAAPDPTEPIESIDVSAPTKTDPSPVSCVPFTKIELCVSQAITDNDGTHVSVEARILDEQIRLVWPFIAGDYTPNDDPVVFLIDNRGRKFDCSPDPFSDEPFFPVDENQVDQVLNFAPLPPDVDSLTLHVPLIVVEAPANGSIEINLGADPGPGSTFNPDASIEVAGQVVRFDLAEIDDQHQLHVYSAPIDFQGNVILRWLNAGMPEGWSSGIGPGNKYNFETRR
jgi:hypothetical protein